MTLTSMKGVTILALTYTVLMISSVDVLAQETCDKVFSSYQLEEKTGDFQSPGYPSHYPNGVSCKYKFIARDSERVKIKFHSFALQGRPPTCKNDFVNIYSQLEHESDDLLDADMAGPFCGENVEDLPKLILSTHSITTIWFYSNGEKSNSGFKGTWHFIDAVNYDMGTAAPRVCGFTVRSENRKHGYIMSPTYPGMYADNLSCFYKLQGRPGQRIKLTFHDFALFYGGEYCPFDYLRIYDGHTNSDRIIGTFCGSFNKSTIIYSSSEALRLDFITTQGRMNFEASPIDATADFKFERRGFNISYTFTEALVQLDDHYIKEGAEHVLGTECDIRIMSGKETNGTFVSPGYPESFKEGIVCRYFLDGLMDDDNLEKVKVAFFDFNIPGNIPYCLLGYLGENEDSRLSEGQVKHKFCGKLNPPDIISIGPRMVITLNTTGAVQGGKFVARYQFITDYGIRGYQIEEGHCKFSFDSSGGSSGEINSPRHPGKYPKNQRCEYIFIPKSHEYIVVTFSVFQLANEKLLSCISGDYIAFYENVGTRDRENFTLTETHCSHEFPGPYITSRMLKLVFHSDSQDTFVGFKADYRFESKATVDKKCSRYVIDTKGSGGIIKSPDYPAKYPRLVRCEWILTASRKTNRILVQFADLNIEGEYHEKKPKCSKAVIRLYTDSSSLKPKKFICGKKKTKISIPSHISERNTFKISFTTSLYALGATGFKISWTEVQSGNWAIGSSVQKGSSVGLPNDAECAGFWCQTNHFCIPDGLKCNGEPNCGSGDVSDETADCPKEYGVQILHIAIGTSISSFFCIILLICGFYHRRKFRNERDVPPDHDHVEVRYVSAPTGCNTTDRLLMEDRTDVANEQHNNGGTTTQSPRCQKVSMV